MLLAARVGYIITQMVTNLIPSYPRLSVFEPVRKKTSPTTCEVDFESKQAECKKRNNSLIIPAAWLSSQIACAR